ncbi:uncharacterized protein RJT20DRAFT_136844 [Scheffersomyces xylosifermentans]|uniref:uncharacterized protein n=1 Tax=Scheffersomyces xylosifermentans TaxID=1304137 RepID=UPI00315C8339
MSMAEPVWNGGGLGSKIMDDDLEWNDTKQAQLATYVEDYSNSLSDPAQFYSKIDWQYLSRILGVKNVELLKIKVDEIYDERFDSFNSDQLNINEIVSHWKKKRNPLFREVARMIESLGIESFEVESERVPSKNSNGASRGEGVDKITDSRVIQNQSSLLKQDMPKLTTNQRRMSLDLMHPKPTLYAHKPTGHRKKNSLTRPAEIGTTNVNVEVGIVRALARTSSTAETNEQKNNKLKEVQKKFRLLGTKTRSQNATGNTKDKAIISGGNAYLRTPQARENPLAADKKARRASLVGDTLPLYIRKQLEDFTIASRLQAPSTEGSPISPEEVLVSADVSLREGANDDIEGDEPSSDGNNTAQISKKRSRLQNLLANSQSLYAHSKDVASVKSSLRSSKNDSNKTTNTSVENGSANSDSEEEDDKEYISPDSLTRYYGVQVDDGDDHDEILRGINGNDDDVDFINVNESYDILTQRNGDDEDERSTRIEFEDDDYLFKI